MKNKSKYICENCGQGISLKEYISVDIFQKALCQDCKNKNTNKKKIKKT